MTTAAGHSLDADGSALVRTLRTETGGNPFFLGEMLRHLAESGAIARGEDGRWSVGTGLTAAGMPQSVREVVLARVRRLGEAATRVLTVAAVCGREFALGTVASAAGEDEDAVLDALEAATAAGLVAAVDGTIERFGFARALVQHTLADELSPARRARTHRAIADAIEAAGPGGVGGRAAELATHLFAAGRPEDGARAITYAIRAGDEAVAALAPTDAAAWYRRALDAMASDADRAERCALEIRLGEAERRSDDVAFLPRLLAAAAEARELGRGDLLIAAALARYRGYQLSGADVDSDQVALIEDALAAAGDADSPDRARLLAASAAELRFGGDPAYVERSRESIAVARRTGDTETLIDTLAWSSFDTPATFGERRRVAEEVLRLTERLDDPLRRFWTLVQAMTTWLTNGDIHSARRGAAEMAAVANRLGSPQNRWIASMWGVQLLVIGGELAEAERASEAAFAIGLDAGRHDTMLYFGSHLMAIRFQQGRSAEVVPLIEQAIIEYPRVPGFRSVHAYALAEVGDLAGARERFSALAREGFAFPEDQVWMAATVLAAETAHHLGDREAAAILLERLVPYTDRIALQSVTASLGAVSHYVGLLYATLGEAERAEAHLLDAVDRNTRFETPYYRARTMLALARLVRDRDPVRSESLVADAVAVADRYGFAGLGTAAAAVASEG